MKVYDDQKGKTITIRRVLSKSAAVDADGLTDHFY